MMKFRHLELLSALLLIAAAPLVAQVSYESILGSDADAANWPTYSGAYHGRHYREIDQINRRNVADLQLSWVYQGSSTNTWQSTPIAWTA
jgi:glucose dehydrogenase